MFLKYPFSAFRVWGFLLGFFFRFSFFSLSFLLFRFFILREALREMWMRMRGMDGYSRYLSCGSR